MIFNCLGCGTSISTKREKCPYCKVNNIEAIEVLTGIASKPAQTEWKERIKGTILSYVLR